MDEIPHSTRSTAPLRSALGRAAGFFLAAGLALGLTVAPLGAQAKPKAQLRPEAKALEIAFNPPPIISLGIGDLLNVPLFGQETNVWCWDASSLMVIKYFRPASTLRQCDLATQATPGVGSCCASPMPAACVHTGWEMLTKNSFAIDTSGTALPWADLVAQISTKKKPVLYAWAWNGGGGHMMVAYGWFSLAGHKYVRINNPWPPGAGAKESYTYDAWVGGAGYDHTTWENWYNIVDKGRRPIVHGPFIFKKFDIPIPIGPDPLREKLTVHPDITRRATTTLDEIRSIPPALAPHLGFAAPGEAKEAQLGTPLREYSVRLDALRDYTAKAPASRLLSDGTTLFYPIVARGAIRSSVRVSAAAGKAPQTISIGDTGVASRLELLTQVAPQLRKAGGDSIPAVRIPALGLYFVARSAGGKLEVASLFDVPNLGLKRGAFESLDAVLARVAPVAKALPDGVM